MLSEIIIIMIGMILISQYYSERNQSRPLESEIKYTETKRENQISNKSNYTMNIDLMKIDLDELRKLDKTYFGIEKGIRIHEIRKERIILLRNESKRKFGLANKIKNINPNELQLGKLERIVKIIGE